MVREALVSAVPRERKIAVRKRTKLQPAISIIDTILEGDQKVPQKQRHTANRIWRRLCEELLDLEIAESTVRKYVRERKHEIGLIGCAPTKQQWMEWLYSLEMRDSIALQCLQGNAELIDKISESPNSPRKRALVILAQKQGFSINAIAEHLGIERNTVRRYLTTYEKCGAEELFQRKQKKLKSDVAEFQNAVFEFLHEPPALSGFNRTTWRMEDLQKALRENGHCACGKVIRQVIKKAGYRWKSARIVLTSTDPKYREKLEYLQQILSRLKEDERFFSIDEYGPFAIKMIGGRILTGPGEIPTVPQWQKSKGFLILTAALELSNNRVSHFYSNAKNTAEMIRMAKVLIDEYREASTLYLSWDVASWHMSKELLAFVAEHNENCRGSSPRLELVPLPASAQFLNVIESVFSGMARAIIHNSDYPSKEAAMQAIDRYFSERNQYHADNPKRAGKKIWGKERTSSEFSKSNNCKDPRYR